MIERGVGEIRAMTRAFDASLTAGRRAPPNGQVRASSASRFGDVRAGMPLR